MANPWTIDDLLDALGGIEGRRVWLDPAPGTATEKDVLLAERKDRLCELVDGTLVEKVMGFSEGHMALRIGRLLDEFAERHDLGLVAGADATVRLMPGLVRIPDVCFVSWERLPSRMLPTKAIPALVPDLAVEVLSKRNTPGEMQRKLKEYFLTGVLLVWFVDPRRRIVRVFTSPDESKRLREGQTLDGGEVLPGFKLPVARIFERVEKRKKKRA